MKLITFIHAAAGVLIFSTPAWSAPVRASAQPATTHSSFILWCDCDTPSKRAHIQRKIAQAGGKVFYVYEQMGGFAVTAPASMEKRLRRISGVYGVYPDRVIRLGEPGGPQ